MFCYIQANLPAPPNLLMHDAARRQKGWRREPAMELSRKHELAFIHYGRVNFEQISTFP